MPIEIVAAKPAGDIDHFAYEIEAGNVLCFHRLGIEITRINAAQRDLSRAVAF